MTSRVSSGAISAKHPRRCEFQSGLRRLRQQCPRCERRWHCCVNAARTHGPDRRYRRDRAFRVFRQGRPDRRVYDHCRRRDYL